MNYTKSSGGWSSGVGVKSALLSSIVVFAIDGIVSVLDSVNRTKLADALASIVFCCAFFGGIAGIVLGLGQELLLARAKQLPWMRRIGKWIISGPSTWFAPDPNASMIVTVGSMTLSLYIFLVYLGSAWSIHRFHRPVFVAAGCVTVALGVVIFLAMFSTIMSGYISRFLSGPGSRISPGMIISGLLILLTVSCLYFLHNNHNVFMFVDKKRPVFGLLWVVLDVVILIGLSRQRSGRVTGATLFVVCGISAFITVRIMNRNPTAAGTVYSGTLLTGYVVRVFHQLTDFDRDGYSPYLGGRDCDDHNIRVHPGMPDIRGNGIDENCSNGDSIRSREAHTITVESPSQGNQPSFVLLSIDAMRPDHMGIYGYRRMTTPNIDRFSRNAAYFSNVYCTVPNSIGSLASIWTGRYFSEDATTTLGEQLTLAGYRTAAFSGDNYFSSFSGFYRGFSEVFEGQGIKNDGTMITTRLRNWLHVRSREPEPFFSWMHLVEPHVPYVDRTEPVDFGHSITDQYDEGIARADQILQPLLTELEAIGNRRNLVVIIFADHGEGLGEHGVFSHASDLHDEALHVPVIVWNSGIVPGRRRTLASLLDLHPTMMSLAGIQPAEPVSGFSLVPSLRAHPETEINNHREVFSEIIPSTLYEDSQYSLYTPPYKLIYNMMFGTYWLYDLSSDPQERNDLSSTNQPVFDSMSRSLRGWVDSATITHGRQGRVFFEYGSGITRLRSGGTH